MRALSISTKPVIAVLVTAAALVACQSDEEKLSEFLERGRAAVEAEKHKEAIIEYRNVLQIDPQSAEAHWALAESYIAIQKPKEAFWMLHESVRLDPKNLDARKKFAQFSLLARDFDEVLVQTDVLTKELPTEAMPWGLRGDALLASNRKEDAEVAYRDLGGARGQ